VCSVFVSVLSFAQKNPALLVSSSKNTKICGWFHHNPAAPSTFASNSSTLYSLAPPLLASNSSTLYSLAPPLLASHLRVIASPEIFHFFESVGLYVEQANDIGAALADGI